MMLGGVLCVQAAWTSPPGERAGATEPPSGDTKPANDGTKAPAPPAAAAADPAPTPPNAELAPDRRKAVEEELRKIAQGYKKYSRVSDDRVGWAPESCIGPPPPSVKETAAPQGSPHGRKLYFLYARDEKAYLEMSGNHWRPRITSYMNPVGQIVVKEAFVPVTAESERARYTELENVMDRRNHDSAEAREYERYTEDDAGKLHKAGDLSGLFVMLKLDPRTPGTDQGWVYATLDKDLTTITSLGVIESCMNCHKQTNRDRLYGKRTSWPNKWPSAESTPKTLPTPTAPTTPATPTTPTTPR